LNAALPAPLPAHAIGQRLGEFRGQRHSMRCGEAADLVGFLAVAYDVLRDRETT